MKRFAVTLLLVSAFACMPFAAAQSDAGAPKSRRDAESMWNAEGLSKLNVKGLDVVYARPGATLGGYDKFMLRPITVAFQRDWEKRSAPGTRTPIKTQDAQRIKDRLSALVREEVTKQLNEGGYMLVDAPGDNVLEVALSIVNLDVNAPDIKTAGRVETYALSAGEMTLVADLRDSASGDIIMRVFDRTQAREYFHPQRITSVDNAAEARTAASAWAKALRKELDLARSAGTATP